MKTINNYIHYYISRQKKYYNRIDVCGNEKCQL